MLALAADNFELNPMAKGQFKLTIIMEAKTMEKKTREELLLIYDVVGEFFKGLAVARKDDKWLHIHPDGSPVYKQRYDYVSPFFKGLAVACKNGRWFHIRKDGSPAYKGTYEYISSFSRGYARAKKDGVWLRISIRIAKPC